MRQNLIAERKLNNLTQDKTANLIGITPRHYKSLEAGTSNGSVTIWEKLRNLFNKSIDYLLEQESN